ncbi:group II intron reverse transcriptase/maturase (plasmid) [Okeanomitos corallinicola TIOX110]|uniref:Group II intron reverse transcriptase/maturase n=1 Tax=Okeanomitos corallinicola TIOX110 TaxID=3133117 RepID=A0ABZ2V1P7_9CYAN
MSKTSFKTTVEWQSINWRKLERRVFKLQKRIFKASQRGDVKAVRRLQKTLMKSWSAKCLAVRRVTQDNQGKKTAGVDGVKSLTPQQRLSLISQLKLGKKAAPTRRVWIPKPGTQEKRPLGIPTIKERAKQALVKLALEPEWEARFEVNSFGFRPGRSCHDAVEAIFNAIRYKAKYVLDADIAKCFDQIDHKALLEKLHTFPSVRRQIKAWLKAGVMDGKTLFPTEEGTPQGGILSPLLANVALHGMENRIKQTFKKAILIRYADDFVILHEDLSTVQKCQEIIADWLKDMGLTLKPSKTRLAHTLNEHGNEQPGFDFLGFNVRHFPVGQHHTGKNTYGKPLGFKTIITPSKAKQKEHYEAIAEIIEAHKGANQATLIKLLNPVISGWSNYYSTVVSKEAFSHQDYLIFQKLVAWARHRHADKSWEWISRKYWQTIGGDQWVFATQLEDKNPQILRKHNATPIVRHIKVKGDASPFNGDFIYWSTRMGKHPEAPHRVSMLLKRQKGKCAHCELFFRDGDVMEIDHKIPRSQGGKDEYRNLQLLHRHCHDVKTALDAAAGGVHDKAPNH